jgi:uncharacterized membrane protein YcaP (DUF421 family)
LLVKDGKILEDFMMKARISEDEFESYLRLSGTDDISDIKLSYLEINGQVSLSKQRKKTEKNSTTTIIIIIGCCLYIFVVWIQF